MREDLEKYHLDSKRIKNENNKFKLDKTELFFDWIFVSDIILRKDFINLEKQLDKFFSINSFTYQNYQNRNINKFFSDNNYRWKVFLPMISSKEHSLNLNKKLPENVDFIEIQFEKVCSDFISIDIIFYFNDIITNNLNKIFVDTHKPEIIENFNNSKWQSYNILSVRDIKRREVNNFITNIKKSCLIFILEHIDLWELYKINNNDWFNNLPSLNIFSFKSEWNKLLDNRNILDLINFHYNDIETFIYEDKYYLYWEEKEYTLLIDWNKFKNFKVDFSPYWILLDFKFFYISLFEFLIHLDLKIDEISSNILNNINNLKKISLEKQKLIDNIIIFDRLWLIINWLKSYEWEFKRLKRVDKYENNFDKIYLEAIKNFISKKSILISRTSLNINSLFELKNTTENMNLQNKILILTIMMIILVVLQVLFIEYEEGYYIYNFFINLIKWAI